MRVVIRRGGDAAGHEDGAIGGENEAVLEVVVEGDGPGGPRFAAGVVGGVGLEVGRHWVR